ncbi:MAG: DUF4386 domain-containing protein [Cyclobacteriaceae bacterium]|jgi:hypothetical protein|tara:strand:- start:941 stop:1624 length:684 start_codon:yes stop_codon:yes gene_type:complete
MNSNKQISRIAGILILFGIIAGLLSIVPSVESTDFLKEVFPNKSQVLSGAVFQFLLVPIYIGFALILYKTLKAHKENSAIGFVGFRMIAGAFQIFGVILLPLFIYLSKTYLTSAGESLLYLEKLGEMLKIIRDLTNHLGVMVATGLGNLLLYHILFSGKYIPKWLSTWGIIGNALIILASFLILFQAVDVISTTYIAITIPLVVQELVFAFWLIFKGLNPENANQLK